MTADADGSATSGRPVKVVTDSTSDLPREIAASLGVAVVPLTVTFGDRVYRDGVDLDAARFLAELGASTVLPKTSQPPVAAFEEAFHSALEDGNDVVCVTIGSGLSGTYNAARLAAEAVDGERIRVMESATVSMRTGLAVIEGAAAAQGGADAAAVSAAVESALTRSNLFAVLESLEYLHRGGRIGRASHMVGSLLSIKPILTVRDNEVVPVERVRTWRKALERIAQIARDQGRLARLVVLHVGNPGDAAVLASQLAELVPESTPIVGEIGPVVATYAGPGAVGIVTLTAPNQSTAFGTSQFPGDGGHSA